MPTLVDVIDTYSNGSTGTITDSTGKPVDYAITGTATNSQGAPWEHDSDSARIYADGAAGSHFDINLDAPIDGLLIEMRGSDTNEFYAVRVDGVVIDLNEWIADGRAIFTTTGAGGAPGNHFVDANGLLSSTGSYDDGSVGYVQFTIPISQLGIEGASPNDKSGFDNFEIGVVPDAVIVCFCAGTLIETAEGPRAVETLKAGDLVKTLDGGPQPIRWIGESRVDGIDLQLNPKRRPIRIRAGALGAMVPARDLLVSCQHRILLRSALAEQLFGSAEILVPAVKLLALDGVEIVEEAQEVSYWHILLDRHELIFGEGAVCESLYTGAEARAAIPEAALRELVDLGFWTEDARMPSAMIRPEIRNSRSVGELLRLHVAEGAPLVL